MQAIDLGPPTCRQVMEELSVSAAESVYNLFSWILQKNIWRYNKKSKNGDWQLSICNAALDN